MLKWPTRVWQQRVWILNVYNIFKGFFYIHLQVCLKSWIWAVPVCRLMRDFLFLFWHEVKTWRKCEYLPYPRCRIYITAVGLHWSERMKRIKRVSAPYAQDLQSPSGTLQPSCSMDYYLWKSLHVVRTWAESLSSSGADGERALFSVPIAPLTHLSQFLYQFLFIVLTVYKSKSSAGCIPSFSLFLFFFFFFFQSGWLLNSLCILFLPVCLLEVVN